METNGDEENQSEVALRLVLDQAHVFGFFGPGELAPVIEHAGGFLRVAEEHAQRAVDWLDLGSGGGLPGLVGVVRRPQTSWTLLDAQEKRVAFLRWALEQLPRSLTVLERVSVAHGRAEVLARAERATESIDVVVARGFAPPAVTAECAARWLRLAGVLVISEPPDSMDGARWAGLAGADLGLELERVQVDAATGAHFSVIRKVARTPQRFPRSGAALAKRPLF
jgi:16S rRNA (guanine527-N7)-methyltransferase